jgi:predicted SnoaL-like aldol condensation-catalyzing enzyme
MAPSRKQQVIDLLKSLETKDPVPLAYVNPNKYIQHNLQVGPGPAGVAALIKNMPPDASVNTVRVFEDGDYVFAHTEYNSFGPRIGFDIFRYEDNVAERIRALAHDGVHHIVEVAFGANIKTDTEVLAQGGSIATYATNAPMPEIPVWQLVFINAGLFFVGSDDVPADAKIEAARAINQALEAGWKGLDIAEVVPLDQIAHAHELVEHPVKPGRVIVAIT